MTPLERLSYDVGQAARVAWFLAHSRLAGRLAPPILEPPEIEGPLPTRDEMMGDLFRLLKRDRANIEAGYYRAPDELLRNPLPALGRSLRFFADLGAIDRRRREQIHAEPSAAGGAHSAAYPEYYRQNFHYQTDGYLSEHSATLYDFQVDVLFNGGADVMRRQALVPIAEHLRGRRLREQRLLDVACGTGRFLAAIKRNYPRLPVTGVDLSVPYLRHAEHALARWSWVELLQGGAEALPFADRKFSLVTCVYLFHELPRAVRRRAAAEMARVLRPGGRLVFVDSFQLGDEPAFDGLLELFPLAYHEPYFADFVRDDLSALFANAGLLTIHTERAYMSKVVVLKKPEAGA
ncbi:MAG TPA: class I SAM-dependent methyltransferase [Geminicoccaceae bacterium]|nr:class I SAM-dependent methyltransferase [Geminicoccaceae bacterium]